MDSIFEYKHPHVCTDAVVFTIETRESGDYRRLAAASVKILLYKRTSAPYENKWCLPGGFLNIDELPEDNIRRKMLEKSHVEQCYLEQLYTFCGIERDPRARVISISYLGLMNEIEAKKLGAAATWFTIDVSGNNNPVFKLHDSALSKEDFGFDHYSIIKTALERLQSKIFYTDIIFNLLPKTFTLTRLQNAYEAITGKKEQAANFRRKIAHMVKETDQYTSDKGHRPALIYTRREQ